MWGPIMALAVVFTMPLVAPPPAGLPGTCQPAPASPGVSLEANIWADSKTGPLLARCDPADLRFRGGLRLRSAHAASHTAHALRSYPNPAAARICGARIRSIPNKTSRARAHRMDQLDTVPFPRMCIPRAYTHLHMPHIKNLCAGGCGWWVRRANDPTLPLPLCPSIHCVAFTGPSRMQQPQHPLSPCLPPPPSCYHTHVSHVYAHTPCVHSPECAQDSATGGRRAGVRCADEHHCSSPAPTRNVGRPLGYQRPMTLVSGL